jgi:hypothetical protein
MSLTKPGQHLKQAAALLRWSGVDLLQSVRRLSEAGKEDEGQEVLQIAVSFQEPEDKLTGYLVDVKSGKINRTAEQDRRLNTE